MTKEKLPCFMLTGITISALCDLLEAEASFKLEEIDGKSVLLFAAQEYYSVVVNRLASKALMSI